MGVPVNRIGDIHLLQNRRSQFSDNSPQFVADVFRFADQFRQSCRRNLIAVLEFFVFHLQRKSNSKDRLIDSVVKFSRQPATFIFLSRQQCAGCADDLFPKQSKPSQQHGETADDKKRSRIRVQRNAPHKYDQCRKGI